MNKFDLAVYNEGIGYLRVSTQKQEKTGYGLADQKETVENEAKRLGIKITHWFVEQETATKKRRRLKQEDALIYCANNRAVFITARLDRFARDYDFCRKLFKSGLPYLFCDSPNAGEFELNIKAVFAEEEARKIADNTKRAMRQRKLLGLPCGSPQNFSDEGRKKGGETMKIKALMNDNNRKAARLSRVLKENGKSLSQIAGELNACGFRTTRGKEFQKTSVKRLLEMYIGYEEYQTV